MIDTEVFKLENGVYELENSVLNELAYESDHKDKLPASFPVNTYQLYGSLHEIANKAKGVNVTFDKLFVPENAVKLIKARNMDPNTVLPLSSHHVKRHVSAIYMSAKDDEEISMAIAVSCSERGIQLAFGPRVHICRNQCIFGNKIMSTFGPSKMPYDKMLNVISDYVNNFAKVRKNELSIVERMQQQELNMPIIHNHLGEMYYESRKNMTTASNTINFSTISKVVDIMIDKDVESNPTTLWDFYNHITEALNPKSGTDGLTTLPITSNVTNYLLKLHNIEVADILSYSEN